jgi:two-component system phosphate regulon response regulator PhoB
MDDEAAIRELLNMILVEENYQVVEFEEFQGMDSLVKADPALIILDAKLPKVSGIEVSQLLKAHPKMRQVPILALSASSEKELTEMCCEAFLPKPFNVDELLEHVEALLKPQSQRLEALAS